MLAILVDVAWKFLENRKEAVAGEEDLEKGEMDDDVDEEVLHVQPAANRGVALGPSRFLAGPAAVALTDRSMMR